MKVPKILAVSLPAHPGKCNPRFALITAFWFAQKEPKSLPLDNIFHSPKIYLNAFAAGILPEPTGGSLQHSPTLPSGFKGAASQRNRLERKG